MSAQRKIAIERPNETWGTDMPPTNKIQAAMMATVGYYCFECVETSA